MAFSTGPSTLCSGARFAMRHGATFPFAGTRLRSFHSNYSTYRICAYPTADHVEDDGTESIDARWLLFALWHRLGSRKGAASQPVFIGCTSSNVSRCGDGPGDERNEDSVYSCLGWMAQKNCTSPLDFP